MNRLLQKIQAQKKRKLFCAFLTLGYPNLKATEQLIWEFEKAGVDILELGFPFSDPLADGPTIQFSSEEALRRRVKIEDAFALVSKLRKQGCRLPILFFSYLNPIYHFGCEKFAAEAKKAGFDGAIIPDLPPEEEPKLQQALHRRGLVQIFLVAPTTEKRRASFIAGKSQGFIYYVSLRGVTGARASVAVDVQGNLKQLHKLTPKPVLIGFGVSSPEQGKSLAGFSEGVIVGSAIVEQLRRGKGKIAPAVNFVREMVRAVKGKAG